MDATEGSAAGRATEKAMPGAFEFGEKMRFDNA
jgi:hypothetical protein